MRRILMLSGAALLAMSAVVAAQAPMRNGFTPEEREMYHQQQHMRDGRGLNLDQRCARMRAARQQWANMSPAQRQQLKQQLEARWNALPQAQKQQIEQRIAARRARRAQMPRQVAARRCA